MRVTVTATAKRSCMYRRSERDSAYMTDLGGEANFAIHAAAVNGYLEVAEFLRARVDTPLNHRQRTIHEKRLSRKREELSNMSGVLINCNRVSGATMLQAASYGFFPVVRWLYEEFSVNPEIDLFYNEPRKAWEREEHATAMNGAATRGHLEIVQYLHELGKVINTKNERKRERMETREEAAPMERLNFQERMLGARWPGNGMNEMNGPSCTRGAMDGHNHLNVVKWLHNNRTEGCFTDAMDHAARKGHLDIVKWLHEHRSEGCTKAAMDGAASSGSLDLVKWLHINRTEGCTTQAMDLAAREGHLRVVQWLHEHRSEGCAVEAMNKAAVNGHFETVLFYTMFHTKSAPKRPRPEPSKMMFQTFTRGSLSSTHSFSHSWMKPNMSEDAIR